MMAESDDVQALEKISSEVDESQIKLILSTQCIKAQAFLVAKLKKQSVRRKETCGFLSSANLKLESEIKHAEHEIKSLLIAHETIKMANVELKKEWLLAKEQKLDIIERVKNGEKKYEDLWLESKSRYESIPYVQKFLQAKDRAQTLKEQVKVLENHAENLVQEIEIQKDVCLNLDRKRVVEVANFIIHEMPNSIKLINEKTIQVNDLIKDVDELLKEKEANASGAINGNAFFMHKQQEEEIIKVNTILDDEDSSLIMPKLELVNTDLDVLNVKLDQIKKVDMIYTTPEKRENSVISFIGIDTNKSYKKEKEDNENISLYFNIPSTNDENLTHNYSKKKLINILEDITVNQNDAYNMVSEVNLDKLQPVNVISAEDTRNVIETCSLSKGDKPLISEEIEEVDLTSTYTESILIPPSQFLDVTLGPEKVVLENLPTSQDNGNSSQTKNSQECLFKKKVTFDLPNTLEIHEILEPGDNNETDANGTTNTQLDVSAVCDESFIKIKEMILKKHNLDSSPQFVYTKNMLPQMNDDKIVTSKFFQATETENRTDNVIESQLPDEKDNIMEVDEEQFPNEQIHKQASDNPDKDQIVEMDVDHMVVSSPKKQKSNELQKSNEPVRDFLFGHGPQTIPDSLNESISTMGCDDSDADFPHYSSLLLSPKEDFPMPMISENPEVLSQEVPNFLSGLRKTGLSFFGRMSSSDSKPDSSAQNQGSFNFNFGGEEKKNRGGLFNMFQ